MIKTIPHGLCALIFENTDEIQSYYRKKGIVDPENLEIIRIESIYDRMREFANLGCVGFFFMDGHYPIYFGNRLSEYNIELPTIGYFLNKETRKTNYLGVSGKVQYLVEPKPWVNYQKSDKLIRRQVSFKNEFQIDPREVFYFISDKKNFPENKIFTGDISHKAWIKFEHGSPLRDSYLFSEGSFSIFSEKEFVDEFWESSIELKPDNLEIITAPNLIEYLNWILDTTYPFPLEIGLNPGTQRFLQGYFFPYNENWYLRNVFGLFHISNDLIIEPVIEGEVFPLEDNVNESNAIPPLQTNLATTVSHPLKRIIGSSKNSPPSLEAIELVETELQTSYYKINEGWDKSIDEIEIRHTLQDSL